MPGKEGRVGDILTAVTLLWKGHEIEDGEQIITLIMEKSMNGQTQPPPACRHVFAPGLSSSCHDTSCRGAACPGCTPGPGLGAT